MTAPKPKQPPMPGDTLPPARCRRCFGTLDHRYEEDTCAECIGDMYAGDQWQRRMVLQSGMNFLTPLPEGGHGTGSRVGCVAQPAPPKGVSGTRSHLFSLQHNPFFKAWSQFVTGFINEVYHESSNRIVER